MRSAERRNAMRRALVLAACCAGLSACGSLLGAKPTDAPAENVPATKFGAPPLSGKLAPVAAPASSVNEAGNDIPVLPSIQRAFDDARRALRAGRTDEAERGFKALAQQYPELGGPHANLGLIYREAGKNAQAVAELEQAVRSSPRQPVYLNQLGVAYRYNGQFAQAREAYEKAIAIDERYPAALLNLGILCDMYLGDAQRGQELYERYLALTPGGDAAVSKWITDLKNRRPVSKEASKENSKETPNAAPKEKP